MLGTIIVRVRDLKNQDATPDDIMVREGNDNIVVENRLRNGVQVPCARLSAMLPAAINSYTPMKRESC